MKITLQFPQVGLLETVGGQTSPWPAQTIECGSGTVLLPEVGDYITVPATLGGATVQKVATRNFHFTNNAVDPDSSQVVVSYSFSVPD